MLQAKRAGTIRITASDYATDMLLWPKHKLLLRHHPGKQQHGSFKLY